MVDRTHPLPAAPSPFSSRRAYCSSHGGGSFQGRSCQRWGREYNSFQSGWVLTVHRLEILPCCKCWRWAKGLDPSCKRMPYVLEMNLGTVLVSSACTPASLSFCRQISSRGVGLSLTGVFPMCLLKGNHHQDICKVSRLWSTHRKLGKEKPRVTLSLPGGWTYCLFGFGLVWELLGVKPKSRALAPAEIKVSSFFSYLRQEL